MSIREVFLSCCNCSLCPLNSFHPSCPPFRPPCDGNQLWELSSVNVEVSKHGAQVFFYFSSVIYIHLCAHKMWLHLLYNIQYTERLQSLLSATFQWDTWGDKVSFTISLLCINTLTHPLTNMQTHTVNTCEHGLDLWFLALKHLMIQTAVAHVKSLSHTIQSHCLFSLPFALLYFLYRCILIL